MTHYIQRLDGRTGLLETVSECEDKKQARLDLAEYKVAEVPEIATFRISNRPCKAWKER